MAKILKFDTRVCIVVASTTVPDSCSGRVSLAGDSQVQFSRLKLPWSLPRKTRKESKASENNIKYSESPRHHSFCNIVKVPFPIKLHEIPVHRARKHNLASCAVMNAERCNLVSTIIIPEIFKISVRSRISVA